VWLNFSGFHLLTFWDSLGSLGIGFKGRGRGWRGILGSWQIQISSSSQQLVWWLVWCEDSLQL
jgi:hypothetical protein